MQRPVMNKAKFTYNSKTKEACFFQCDQELTVQNLDFREANYISGWLDRLVVIAKDEMRLEISNRLDMLANDFEKEANE